MKSVLALFPILFLCPSIGTAQEMPFFVMELRIEDPQYRDTDQIIVDVKSLALPLLSGEDTTAILRADEKKLKEIELPGSGPGLPLEANDTVAPDISTPFGSIPKLGVEFQMFRGAALEFQRTVPLPTQVDADLVNARFHWDDDDGTLQFQPEFTWENNIDSDLSFTFEIYNQDTGLWDTWPHADGPMKNHSSGFHGLWLEIDVSLDEWNERYAEELIPESFLYRITILAGGEPFDVKEDWYGLPLF